MTDAVTQSIFVGKRAKNFEAIVSTGDGRLTKGKIYLGTNRVYCKGAAKSGTFKRILVIDNLGEFMTFDPAVFKEVGPMERAYGKESHTYGQAGQEAE